MNPRMRYLTTTVAMLALAGVAIVTLERPAPRAAPRMAKTTTAARPPLVMPPTAATVLATTGLDLTPAQRGRLESLAALWARDTRPIEAQLETVTKEFEQFMRETHGKGRTSLGELRTRSEDVQSLSAELRQRRQRHSEDALSVLDERQRDLMIRTTATVGGTR